MSDRGSLSRAPSRPSAARLDAEAMLARICVRPPYFTLVEPRLEGAVFRASVTAEAPAGRERGPMTGAEIGRHAAIAGSCAVALQQRDARRRYYLAREADCVYEPNPAPYGAPVALQASVLAADKREATARIALAAEGRPLATLTVRYTVLLEPTFERLFQTRRLPFAPAVPALSPYARLLTERFERDGARATAQVDAVPAAACVGHFDGYPALPVAVLMGQLSHLAGALAPAPFRVRRGRVRAQDLAWAGEPVAFEATRLADEAEGWRFACAASAAGRPVGGMDLWLGPADAGWVPADPSTLS